MSYLSEKCPPVLFGIWWPEGSGGMVVLLIVHWLGRKAALQPPQAASKGSQDSTGLGAWTPNMQSGENWTLKELTTEIGVKKSRKIWKYLYESKIWTHAETCSWCKKFARQGVGVGLWGHRRATRGSVPAWLSASGLGLLQPIQAEKPVKINPSLNIQQRP